MIVYHLFLLLPFSSLCDHPCHCAYLDPQSKSNNAASNAPRPTKAAMWECEWKGENSPHIFYSKVLLLIFHFFNLCAMEPSTSLWISCHPAQIQQCLLKWTNANINWDMQLWAQGGKNNPPIFTSVCIFFYFFQFMCYTAIHTTVHISSPAQIQ